MKSHFTTREVAKILALPEWRVRSCVRAGFLSRPRTQRNIASLSRILCSKNEGCSRARSPAANRRILHSLRKQLPKSRNLEVRSTPTASRRGMERHGPWQRLRPVSFNFAERKCAAGKLAAGEEGRSGLNAEQWFDLA